MKAKQIEKLLTGVMNNFLESISDNYIKDIIKNNSYITGGCIPSMLIDEFVNDYDIYFYTKEDADGVKKYFETAHTKNKDDKFHVKLITDNAINLSDKIQLITKFWGDPSFVTDEFDWQHIKSWYSCKEEKLYLTSDVYQLVVEKELIYTGSDYPLSSLMRLKKYIKKGWNVSNTTILHIALDIVASFNKMEVERYLPTCGIDDPVKDLPDWRIIESEGIEEQIFNVDDIIYHMNGVDPIRIQDELVKKTGQYLSIEEIIKIMKGE
jgi:hypothetical protein